MDRDASYKVPAIKSAVAQDDESAIPYLVKDLNNDDSAVRFYAIEGLKRLTDETFGYVYYQDVDARAPAVQKWNAWLEGRKSK